MNSKPQRRNLQASESYENQEDELSWSAHSESYENQEDKLSWSAQRTMPVLDTITKSPMEQEASIQVIERFPMENDTPLTLPSSTLFFDFNIMCAYDAIIVCAPMDIALANEVQRILQTEVFLWTGNKPFTLILHDISEHWFDFPEKIRYCWLINASMFRGDSRNRCQT